MFGIGKIKKIEKAMLPRELEYKKIQQSFSYLI
jgi:hypothetical protein